MTPTNQADLNVTSLTDKGGVPEAHSSSCFQALRLEALNTTLQRKARVGFGMALRTAWYTFAEVIRLVFLMVVFRER
jgi:acid phosphatase family membrane protein YuiD